MTQHLPWVSVGSPCYTSIGRQQGCQAQSERGGPGGWDWALLAEAGPLGSSFCRETPPPTPGVLPTALSRPVASPQQLFSVLALCRVGAASGRQEGWAGARGWAGQGTWTRCRGGGSQCGSRGPALDLDCESRFGSGLSGGRAMGFPLPVLWGLLCERRNGPDPQDQGEPRGQHPCPAQVPACEGFVPEWAGVGAVIGRCPWGLGPWS